MRVSWNFDVTRACDPMAEHLRGSHRRLLRREPWVEKGVVRDVVIGHSYPLAHDGFEFIDVVEGVAFHVEPASVDIGSLVSG